MNGTSTEHLKIRINRNNPQHSCGLFNIKNRMHKAFGAALFLSDFGFGFSLLGFGFSFFGFGFCNNFLDENRHLNKDKADRFRQVMDVVLHVE